MSRSWPGWDGWLLVALTGLIAAVYFGRGRLGGGERLALLLAADVLWLAWTWWERR